MRRRNRRHICFVTGTRAEFGLMQTTLSAIAGRRDLKLSIVATGMHLDRAHGDGVKAIAAAGWQLDAVVRWPTNPAPGQLPVSTGRAMADLAKVFERLKPDIVLVVGDRVEAFAAAAAAHLSGRIVAHIHGGDRALGQVDDALRHAISKLAHLHFPATAASAQRLKRLGEDAWRIHSVGSPGVDGIVAAAASRAVIRRLLGNSGCDPFALLVLHPTDADAAIEARRARLLLRSVLRSGYRRLAIVYPNNDPGCAGIIGTWEAINDQRVARYPDLPRDLFLGLMREAAVLAGNSSSGILEAASFATPVIDIGPRQTGRQRGANVVHVPWNGRRIAAALRLCLKHAANRKTVAATRRCVCGPKRVFNLYGKQGTGRRIASALACVDIGPRLRQKLISY